MDPLEWKAGDMNPDSDTGSRLRSLCLPDGGVRSVFSSKVADYVASRPDYPPALFDMLAEKWAIDHGHRELASDAEIANTSSIRLHKIAGIREVGRRVHFVKLLTKLNQRNPATDED